MEADLILLPAKEEVENLLEKPFNIFNEVFVEKLLEKHLYFFLNGVKVFPEWNLYHEYPDKKLGIFQIGPSPKILESTRRKIKQLTEIKVVTVNFDLKEDIPCTFV